MLETAPKCLKCRGRGVVGIGTEDEDFCSCPKGVKSWHRWLIAKTSDDDMLKMVRAYRTYKAECKK